MTDWSRPHLVLFQNRVSEIISVKNYRAHLLRSHSALFSLSMRMQSARSQPRLKCEIYLGSRKDPVRKCLRLNNSLCLIQRVLNQSTIPDHWTSLIFNLTKKPLNGFLWNLPPPLTILTHPPIWRNLTLNIQPKTKRSHLLDDWSRFTRLLLLLNNQVWEGWSPFTIKEQKWLNLRKRERRVE